MLKFLQAVQLVLLPYFPTLLSFLHCSISRAVLCT